MLKKLEMGTYRMPSETERAEFVREAESMIEKYGWENRTVMPWAGTELRIVKIIEDLKAYDECTRSSKEYVVILVNGLADTMNAWESHELEIKFSVRSVKTGKVLRLSADFATMLVEEGAAVWC